MWTRVVIAGVVLPGMLGAGCIGGMRRSRIPYNETSAVASLVVILAGQATFHKTDYYGKGALVYANPIDGKGFPDLFQIKGKSIMLIDRTLAQATSPNSPKAGYYFVDITKSANGTPYDPAIEFGVCAVPVEYGSTGLNTFIMDVGGTVYQKENGGKPLTRYPDLAAEGWIAVGR